jgi:hypothetical protein
MARICFVSAGITDYSWGVGYILVKGRTERLASLVPATGLHGFLCLMRIDPDLFARTADQRSRSYVASFHRLLLPSKLSSS